MRPTTIEGWIARSKEKGLPRCDECGGPAACAGTYESADGEAYPTCDVHCDHCLCERLPGACEEPK